MAELGWKKDRNLGPNPWNFVEQEDKFGYLNNPRWTKDSKAVDFSEALGIPIDVTGYHRPCGHWHKRPATAWVDIQLLGAGDNGDGQCGQGDWEITGVTNCLYFTVMDTSLDWSDVSCGAESSYALKRNGALYVCGNNDYGQLGLPITGNIYYLVKVGEEDMWADIEGGRVHAVGLKSDGTVWGTGNNLYGQLGTGGSHTEAFTQEALGNTDWAQINVGSSCWHTVAIKVAGSLWVTGYNERGQLGLGDNTDRDGFVQVGSGTDWALVSCGEVHTLAVKADGTLWVTGRNTTGQLGLGHKNDVNAFEQVGSATDWAAPIAGEYHSYAIKTDGTIYATGANDVGQLGQGDYVELDVFTQIGLTTLWRHVGAGQSGAHMFAIGNDDVIWAVGSNNAGQLGIGSYDVKTTLTKLLQPAGGNWIMSDGGISHSLALKGVGGTGVEELDEPQVWPLTETHKPTANVGDRLVGPDDPVWDMEAGEAVTTKHTPCGYWWKGEAEVYTPDTFELTMTQGASVVVSAQILDEAGNAITDESGNNIHDEGA